MKKVAAITIVLLVFAAIVIVSRPVANDPVIESVLPLDTTLHVRNVEGSFSITAVSPTKRRFSWRGRVATDDLGSRGTKYRWYGAFGLYDSRAELRGPGWFEIGIFEEAQRHYSRTSDAIRWLESARHIQGSLFLWTDTGLVAFTHEEPSPENDTDRILEVDLYQLCIHGQRPRTLPGSSDSAISLVTSDGRPAATVPCTNPGPVNNDIDWGPRVDSLPT